MHCNRTYSFVFSPVSFFTQPPMRRMRICFTDFFLFFFVFFVFFVFFPSATKKTDNRSPERLNGFS